jgi:TonB family protein
VADKRALRYALVASLALHALLLLPSSPPVPRLEGRPAPFTVRLTQLESPVQAKSKKELPRPAAKQEQTATELPEAVSRDQYRIELMVEALRRARERYPQLARDNRWEGEVRVGVVVTASGRTTLMLKDGSGYEVLDEHALDALRMAARAVTLPPALRGKAFAVDVRAAYRLDN